MEQFYGNWEMTKVDNFDEFMKTLGVGYILRKAGSLATTYYTFGIENDTMYLIYKIAFKSGTLKFKFNEEFDEVTPDDRKVKSTFWMEGNILMQKQIGKPYNVTIKREIKADGLLHEECQIEGNNISSKRTYKKN